MKIINPEISVFTENGQVDLGDVASTIIEEKDVDKITDNLQIILNPALDIRSGLSKTNKVVLEYWYKLIRKNRIIGIKINNSDTKYDFAAFVDHFPIDEVREGKNTQKALILNCTNLLGSALSRDDIIDSPQVGLLPQIKNDPILGKRADFFDWSRGIQSDGQTVFAGPPQEAIEWILDNTMATNTSVLEMNGAKFNLKTFMSKLNDDDYDGKPIYDFKFLDQDYLFDVSLSRFTGPIINYIYECIDRNFYELIIDSTTSEYKLPTASIKIRTKPFSYRAVNSSNDNWMMWEDLPIIELKKDGDEIFRNTLGPSNYEIKNVFSVRFNRALAAGANDPLGKFGLQFPILNLDSIKKYGLRYLPVVSNMMSFEKTLKSYNENIKANKGGWLSSCEDSGLVKLLKEKRNKCAEWYSYPGYHSGQITLEGNQYTKGTRISLPDYNYFDEWENKHYQGIEAYIKGLRRQYTRGAFCRSTLRLIRGAPKGLPEKWLNENLPNFLSVDDLEMAMIEKENVSIETPEKHKKRMEKVRNTRIQKLNE